jgi:hypothetical protein
MTTDIEDRKRAEEALQQNQLYLSEGQRLAHMGSWAFNATGVTFWSSELFQVYGLDPRGKPPTVEEYLAFVQGAFEDTQEFGGFRACKTVQIAVENDDPQVLPKLTNCLKQCRPTFGFAKDFFRRRPAVRNGRGQLLRGRHESPGALFRGASGYKIQRRAPAEHWREPARELNNESNSRNRPDQQHHRLEAGKPGRLAAFPAISQRAISTAEIP